jgi:hypothetical protein
MTEKSQEWIISNEFAQVRLTVDTLGNDRRLKIEDLSTNQSIALDALMLAGLTSASEEELARHMDPNPRPLLELSPKTGRPSDST